MPNLVPPVATTKDAAAYRERVMAALPAGSTFKPLMTCYLTDDTDADDVERGFRDGVFTGGQDVSGQCHHELGRGRHRFARSAACSRGWKRSACRS